MEKSSHVDKNVLLLDGFDEDSQMLAESIRASGFDGCILTLSDTGFFTRRNRKYLYSFLWQERGRQATLFQSDRCAGLLGNQIQQYRWSDL